MIKRSKKVKIEEIEFVPSEVVEPSEVPLPVMMTADHTLMDTCDECGHLVEDGFSHVSCYGFGPNAAETMSYILGWRSNVGVYLE